MKGNINTQKGLMNGDATYTMERSPLNFGSKCIYTTCEVHKPGKDKYSEIFEILTIIF